jgi:hypothetical protein
MHSVRTVGGIENEQIIQEEIVAEIKLDDMACRVAAPNTTPKTAVLSIPRGKKVLRITSDLISE